MITTYLADPDTDEKAVYHWQENLTYFLDPDTLRLTYDEDFSEMELH